MDEAQQDEVCRSKAKCGTTHFFTYATAYAVVQGRRYTLAICRVRAKQTMDHVVRTLLERLGSLGICMQLLLLDRGFYRVRVLRDLITAEDADAWLQEFDDLDASGAYFLSSTPILTEAIKL